MVLGESFITNSRSLIFGKIYFLKFSKNLEENLKNFEKIYFPKIGSAQSSSVVVNLCTYTSIIHLATSLFYVTSKSLQYLSIFINMPAKCNLYDFSTLFLILLIHFEMYHRSSPLITNVIIWFLCCRLIYRNFKT